MRETLSTTRASEYFKLHGLTTLTGLTSNRWDKAIVKELLYNALDAINKLDAKELWLDVGDDGFTILDNGSGIAEADQDKIFDFNLFVLSKRDFRVATRGAQGNALKVINWVRRGREDTPMSLFFNRKYLPFELELAQIEKEARKAKVGLWSYPGLIPPWEYQPVPSGGPAGPETSHSPGRRCGTRQKISSQTGPSKARIGDAGTVRRRIMDMIEHDHPENPDGGNLPN